MCIASTPCIALHRPERVAVTIECIFQNITIGFGISLSLFHGDERHRAAGSPLYYGVAQTVIIPIYLFAMWKLGWTYAPSTDPLWKVLRNSYQVSAPAEDGAPLRSTTLTPHPTPIPTRTPTGECAGRGVQGASAIDAGGPGVESRVQ